MSRWLLDQPRLSLPTAALELGCGMGLVSLTAAHLGLLIEGTDRQEIAVDFSARNATRNELSGFRSSQLEWSTRGPAHLASQLLLASDVLYEPEAAQPLFELIQTGGLLAPGGMLVLAVPRERRELVDLFVARLRALGYRHRLDPRGVEWEGEDRFIDIHMLSRPD